jgi:diguanylate cyclase (GGDEF)-like protein
VGVDFDAAYYLNREARFRSIAIATLGVAMLLALGIGYVVAVYHSAISRRIHDLYDSSIRDSLTGMLNRRGAMHVVKKALESHAGSSAMLLVDIDNLKIINDLRGHSTGDAVVARTADAIRRSLRPRDDCARLGDEFLIYAPDCSKEEAVEIAEAILRRLAKQGMPLVGAAFSVRSVLPRMRAAGRTMPASIARPTRPCIRRGPKAETPSPCTTLRPRRRSTPITRRKYWSSGSPVYRLSSGSGGARPAAPIGSPAPARSRSKLR